jgi:hypothetical protein
VGLTFLRRPTALWNAGEAVHCSQLLLCRTFRFLKNVPGDFDVEAHKSPLPQQPPQPMQVRWVVGLLHRRAPPGFPRGIAMTDPPPRLTSRPLRRPEHVPKVGALIGAVTRGIAPPSHPTLRAPRRLDEFPGGPWRARVGPYSQSDTRNAWLWYLASGLMGQDAKTSADSVKFVRALTDGVPEMVWKRASGMM